MIASVAIAGVGEWKVYTAKNAVRNAVLDSQDPHKVWVATSGGMFSYRLDDNSFQQFTTSEGLRTNDLTAITIDSNGNVWTGAADGFLHRYAPSADEWQYITDIYADDNHGANKQINGFQIFGDTLFVCSDIGVSVLSISRIEFGDTYTSFGAIGNQLTGNVTGAQLFGGKLWISTTKGVASTPQTNVNPSSPETWQVYTTTTGLPSNIVHRLEILNGMLFAVTAQGLASYNGSGWTSISTTVGMNIIDFKSGISICPSCPSYFITSDNQLWELSDTTVIQMIRQFSVSLSSLVSPTLFGTASNGLLVVKTDSVQTILSPGPPTNKFVGIAVDEKGVLWSGTGKSNGIGFMSFNGIEWKLYSMAQYPEFRYNDFFKVSIGSNNSKWISGWGAGVVLVDADGTVKKTFNTSNGIPPCITNNLQYAVVTGMAVDEDGVSWITSRTPPGDTILIRFRQDSSISYLTGCILSYCQMRTPLNFFTDIVIDDYGTKWFANYTQFEPQPTLGFFYYNDRYTLPGTTNGWGKLTTTNGLTTNNVWCMAVDQENALWVGSDEGISIIFDPSNPLSSIATYHPLRDQIVQDIAVDALDNKWIATKQGVFVLSSDGTSILNTYTVESTHGKLLDDNVTAVAIDNSTGTIYFASEKGLSSLTTTAVTPKQSFGDLSFAPNPFVLPSSTVLAIEGLVRSSSLKILSIDGSLVREVATPGGRVGYWDGRNTNGEYVASGVYLVVAFSDDGNQITTGKIAVIRK